MSRSTLQKIVIVASLAVIGLAAAPVQATMDKTGWPSSVIVGTGTTGGTYFIYGAGWAGLMQEMLGISATAYVTGGPLANMALVHFDDHQFGMITMGPGHDSWTGESEMAPGVEMRNVRALFPMYATPFHAIAMKASNISQVADLNGKQVNVGPRTGTAATYWGRMFEALGVKVHFRYGNASDAAGQLQDNLIDTFAFAAGIPISAFSEVEAQKPATIFAFTADEQAKMVEQFPSMTAFTIPAGTYRSQEADILTVSMANFAIAHKDLPESLVYEVMKVVLDNNDRMVQIHQSAAETRPENWNQNRFMWFHPGAIRYYQEKGFNIPNHLIPPEYETDLTAAALLIAHYYQAILGRTPEPTGLAFWESEVARLHGLGIDIRETFRVMAGQFFTSSEYLDQNASAAQYITDLYNTFFNRDPDSGGLSYWTGQLSAGLPRSVVLFSFLFSEEFAATMRGLFGETAGRPEIAAVVDFYRGFLNRSPDEAGFAYWLDRFRIAQCQGAAAVTAEVERISAQFLASPEYVGRQRDHQDVVADLYYAFLRRGGEAAGFQYWVDRLAGGSLTRDGARQAFVQTPEFQNRVARIITEGCMQ